MAQYNIAVVGVGADWAKRQFAAKNTMNRRRSMRLVPEGTEYTQTRGSGETWLGVERVGKGGLKPAPTNTIV